MGYVVFHMEKASGMDNAMSDHIERRVIAPNVDPSRSHLNRILVEYPDGAENRTQAIQHRLDHAGLTRKIGKNQVRVVRIMLSGSPDEMKRIVQEGELEAWCADNVQYLADTFGRENIVSAVLHMDEKTPHIHATLVPIVKGERKRKKSEEQVKKRYRRKPADAVRLCADEVMSRQRLKAYQDTYAEAMSRYGLQRGVDGSQARHIATGTYYRELKRQTGELSEEVRQLQEQRETAQEALDRAKKEIQTERLKGAATTAATNIAESVGSLFGSNKVKALERENKTLRREITAHTETIEILQTKMQTMQADHSRRLLEMQQQHRAELKAKDTEHRKEISLLKTILSKAVAWFPYFREMLRMENFCRTVGFDEAQTATLIKGKSLEYSSELYSEEHRHRFFAENVTARIAADDTDKRKLTLKIDGQSIGEWFKTQFDKVKQTLQPLIRQQRKSRGI